LEAEAGEILASAVLRGHVDMLVNWAYVNRKTFFHRLDPRARIIFMLCVLISVGFIPGRGTGFWDMRIVLFFLGLAFLQIALARLTWRQMRRFWIVITLVAVMLSLITLLTGRGSVGVYDVSMEHVIWTPPAEIFGLRVPAGFELSAERVSYLITQLLRIMTFAALSVVIPYTIDPALYGITFKGLGLSDKIAYAMDMAFRFIPTLGRDMQTIMDAQRARGFELEARKGKGLIQRVRNFAPLLIPLTIGAVVEGEEISDAMDLRGFGIGPRTWLPQLSYSTVDWIYIGLGLLFVAAGIVAKRAGFGGLWVPPWLYG
jgi:energy-coupling factor transport system permease protein